MIEGSGKPPTAAEVFGEPGLKQHTVAKFTIDISSTPRVAPTIEPLAEKVISRVAAPLKPNGAYDISAIFGD